jgi:hypothetical protein
MVLPSDPSAMHESPAGHVLVAALQSCSQSITVVPCDTHSKPAWQFASVVHVVPCPPAPLPSQKVKRVVPLLDWPIRHASVGRQPWLVSGLQLGVHTVPVPPVLRLTQAPPGAEHWAFVVQFFSHCWPPPSKAGAQLSPAAHPVVPLHA